MKVVTVDAGRDVLIRLRPGAAPTPVYLKWARRRRPASASLGVVAGAEAWEVTEADAVPPMRNGADVALYPEYAWRSEFNGPAADGATLRVRYRAAYGMAHGGAVEVCYDRPRLWCGTVVPADRVPDLRNRPRPAAAAAAGNA